MIKSFAGEFEPQSKINRIGCGMAWPDSEEMDVYRKNWKVMLDTVRRVFHGDVFGMAKVNDKLTMLRNLEIQGEGTSCQALSSKVIV